VFERLAEKFTSRAYAEMLPDFQRGMQLLLLTALALALPLTALALALLLKTVVLPLKVLALPLKALSN